MLSTLHSLKGHGRPQDAVPVRVHASSMIGDVFQVSDLGKGPQLHAAMSKIEEIGYGAVVFINKLHQGGGFAEELLAYADTAKNKKSLEFSIPLTQKTME